MEYEEISIWRQGSYTRMDFIMGLLMFLLVMELSRIAHNELFWVNVIMVVYTLWGYLSPIDFFWHPGTTFYRVITSSTVELSTGIYGLYSQIAMTTIGAFLLLAAAARGFDAQGAMVHFMRRIAGKSRATIPQTAVLASSAVGMISGSGAANATVVGSFTIPLMKRYGVPGEFAGAVETSASMGGLIMPPVMAVAGFIMAEFLGVSYWSVCLRGFALAFIYYSTLSLSIYLLSVRLMPPDPIEKVTMPVYDQIKTAIFFLGIIFLTILMGVLGLGEQLAGLYTGAFMFALLILLFLYFKYGLQDLAAEKDALFANVRIMIETHAELTSYLTLLLATLGIMICLFTVTGFINRMGGMLLHLGEWHVIALILMAYAFGWLVGAGLPPTATYIVLAVIIVDPLRKLGVDIWVAHFFVFLIAVWGELSPPTSLAAAVSARIAEASFMKTMWQALKLCLPITIMTFAIFTRSRACGEAGLGNDRGYAARGHRLLGHHLIYVREDCPQPGLGRDGARGAGPCLIRGDVPPERQLGTRGGGGRAAGSDLRHLSPRADRPAEERAAGATRGIDMGRRPDAPDIFLLRRHLEIFWSGGRGGAGPGSILIRADVRSGTAVRNAHSQTAGPGQRLVHGEHVRGIIDARYFCHLGLSL